MRKSLAAFAVALAAISGARAQEAAPYAFDIPPWFASTFLDFREDIGDAARQGRRLLVYFGQDGCPYCKQLMVTNFSQRSIVEKTRQHFVALAVNMWGDREVTWLDGRVMTEKELARVLKVQFTPTLLFFDEKGKVVARLNGYYPPQRFEPVLDYVAGHLERRQALGDYLRQRAREPASPVLRDPLGLPAAWSIPFGIAMLGGAAALLLIAGYPDIPRRLAVTDGLAARGDVLGLQGARQRPQQGPGRCEGAVERGLALDRPEQGHLLTVAELLLAGEQVDGTALRDVAGLDADDAVAAQRAVDVEDPAGDRQVGLGLAHDVGQDRLLQRHLAQADQVGGGADRTRGEAAGVSVVDDSSPSAI